MFLDTPYRQYFTKKNKLCQDCRRRLKRNPLRLLDCKEDKCIRVGALAPQIIDHLCQECHDHFKSVLEYLDELELPYTLNPHLVRGLDYYTRTVFEIWSEGEENFRGSLAGGGRYDYLVEQCGGPATPAIGFSIGIERTLLHLNDEPVDLVMSDHKMPGMSGPELLSRAGADAVVVSGRATGEAADIDELRRAKEAAGEALRSGGAVGGDNHVEAVALERPGWNDASHDDHGRIRVGQNASWRQLPGAHGVLADAVAHHVCD